MSKARRPTNTDFQIIVDLQALKHRAVVLGCGSGHVVKETVRTLTMDGVVAQQHILFAHAQWDAQHIFDEKHDERGPDGVPADDEESTNNLQPNLLAIAVDSTTWVCVAKAGNTGNGCKETGQEAADDTRDEVRVCDS